MWRIILGLCCAIAAGDLGTNDAAVIPLGVLAVGLIWWGNASIARKEDDSYDL